MARQYKNLINGQMVGAERWLDVVNPATEQVIGRIPDCGQGELDAAVDAARTAFKTWRKVALSDVRGLAEKLFWSSFINAGQICIAAKRVYIHEDIYDELSAAI